MYLLRSRLTTRIPSCTPQRRLNRFNVITQPVRYSASNASNTLALIKAQYAGDHSPSNTYAVADRALDEPLYDSSCAYGYGMRTIDSSEINEATGPGTTANQPFIAGLPPYTIQGDNTSFWMALARTIISEESLDESLVEMAPRLCSPVDRALEKRSLYGWNLKAEVSTRLKSLYGCEETISQWSTAFDDIYRAKLNHQEARTDRIPTLTKDGLSLLEKIQTDCQGLFCQTWQELDRDTKAAHWQPLAFWLLRNSPELSLEFLLVTCNSSVRPNFNMVANYFCYLEYFCLDKVGEWKKDHHTYSSVLCFCMSPRDWPVIFLSQSGVRLYLKHCDYHEVVSAYYTMRFSQSFTLPATALCFMRHFTEHGDIEMALKALEWVPRLPNPSPEQPLESQSVMRHCCKLLTLDFVIDGPDGRNFRILPRLLQMGLRPDRDMMNVVLSNAFKTGDSQLGYDMLQYMKGQGFELDVYTYMALLMDAVDRGDRGRVEALVADIKRHEEIRAHPYIVSKVFHAHYVFTAKYMDPKADPSDVFYSVLGLYNQLHDIGPLKALSIIPPHYTPPPGGANTRPSLMALYVMIATYFRCEKRIPVVQRIYMQFRRLVAQGHEVIAPLAETDHTYNEFLCAFRSNPEGIRPCVRIVEDMLQGRPLISDSDVQPDHEFVHTKPTSRTWTILMSAFIYNNQLEAAEKVKQMMAHHQVEYNHATWNTIISGYVNMQKIPEAAKSIRMMETQGFKVDAYTMKSLRYLRDPERLWMAIDELDKIEAAARGGDMELQHDDEDFEHQERRDLLYEKLGNLKTTMEAWT